MTSKSKSILPNNGMALCIIIIVVVGLFIHYELGYNFELFNVGGRRRGSQRDHDHHHDYNNMNHRFRDAPIHHRLLHYFYPTHSHLQNNPVSRQALFDLYDLDKSTAIEKGEFDSALYGDLGAKINDKNKYVFTA